MMIDRSLAGKSLVQKLISLVDAVGYLGLNHRLAVKARHFHVLVRSDDNALRLGNLLTGKHVLGTAGAVGFNLDPDVTLPGMLLKGLGCHKGMGNAGRAGSYGQDFPGGINGDCLAAASCLEFPCLLGINQAEEFIHVLCTYKGINKIRFHQHGCQIAQKLQMGVVGAVRCRNHEEQPGWQSVHSLKIHALRHSHGRQACRLYPCALGMRSGDAVPQPGGAGSLPLQHILDILLLVGQLAGSLHQVSQLVDCLCLGDRCHIQLNALPAQ